MVNCEGIGWEQGVSFDQRERWHCSSRTTVRTPQECAQCLKDTTATVASGSQWTVGDLKNAPLDDNGFAIVQKGHSL